MDEKTPNHHLIMVECLNIRPAHAGDIISEREMLKWIEA